MCQVFGKEKITMASLTTETTESTTKKTTTYPQTITGKIDHAESLREQGKLLFTSKKFLKAARLYAQIPAWVSPFCKSDGQPSQAEAMSGMMGGDSGPSASPEEAARAKTLLRIAHQNRAMCFVKLKKFDNALKACTSALQFNDGTLPWKIYRAQAEAYIGKKDMDRAKKSLDEVLKLQGGTDKRTTQLLHYVDKMYAAHAKKERKIYAKMFA
jgi:tetratricopeptide (TPR) repeat protein